jgi:hypothetical protein
VNTVAACYAERFVSSKLRRHISDERNLKFHLKSLVVYISDIYDSHEIHVLEDSNPHRMAVTDVSKGSYCLHVHSQSVRDETGKKFLDFFYPQDEGTNAPSKTQIFVKGYNGDAQTPVARPPGRLGFVQSFLSVELASCHPSGA